MKNNIKKNNNLEIEKKYLVDINDIPFNLHKYKSAKITQAYISKNPSIRIRSLKEKYILNIKIPTNKAYTRIENE